MPLTTHMHVYTSSCPLDTLALVPFFDDPAKNVMADNATASDNNDKRYELVYKTGPDGFLRVTIYQNDCKTPETQSSIGDLAAVVTHVMNGPEGHLVDDGLDVPELQNNHARKWTVKLDLNTKILPTSSLFTTLADGNAEIELCVRVDLVLTGFDDPIMCHKTIITFSVSLTATFNPFHMECEGTDTPCSADS